MESKTATNLQRDLDQLSDVLEAGQPGAEHRSKGDVCALALPVAFGVLHHFPLSQDHFGVFWEPANIAVEGPQNGVVILGSLSQKLFYLHSLGELKIADRLG